MELHHEFTVPVPVDDAWHALLDIERVAPCLPGAAVESYDGRTVNGSVKVKVGPVTVTYRGTAVFEEQDEGAHRMVLVASGRETRGQGTARATVTGTLTERDGGTAVSVDTDLTVTGRPAQFGRGVLAEVGDRLVGRFASCLEERLAERPAAPVAGAAAPPAEAGATAPPVGTGAAAPPVREEAEPLDLLRTAGLPVAKRVAAALAAAAAVALAAVGLRRRGRTRSGRGRKGARR
ncbi:SRPBCC family protein [Streptomyces collinus]|uniref:Carbon monoxide dehydrogenase subunit G n=1 Tax=Streptomyces collinus (strain DSM 40733 / Tue 365) TaxID=1214242 RepID=S5VZF7_STRC3|nr:SRPBCC family protein [Streptomyces collinus]AGS73375.1 carbon monoxide dehydrogenase subunit G [Streptomyces collinus Tu 365]